MQPLVLDDDLKFLLDYQAQPNVFLTESGLAYRIIKPSDGAVPESHHKVKVWHKITLPDETIVDDTYESAEPDAFVVEDAIDGLAEGLKMMPTGARYEFLVPPELAWADKGNGGKVGPNRPMVMDVTLVSFG